MNRKDLTRVTPESPKRIGIAVLAVGLIFGSASQAHGELAASIATVPDTLVQGIGLFQNRVLFSPQYLTSAFEASRGQDLSAVVIEIEPVSEDGLAAAYARSYGITHELASQIIESARTEGIDPELGFRLVRVESVFRTNARGSAGALGLTQLMPSTARSIDRTLRTEAQILDPETNLRTGFRYLRQMLDMYEGDVRLALLAYNRGETAVNRALRAGRDPENGYSTKVLSVSGSTYRGKGVAPRR